MQVRRRGNALIQTLVMFPLFVAACAVSIDVGRYYTVKTELQRTADAAALAGAAVLADGLTAVRTEVERYVASNLVEGSALDPAAVDVQLGRWSNGGFASAPTSADVNAIRVTVQRSSTSNNALPLLFGHFFGMKTVNVTGRSTVRAQEPASPYNFVGVERVTFSSIGVAASIKGRVVSNGDISIGNPLGLLVGVNGDARSFGGHVKKGLLAGISGSTQPLPKKLKYPSAGMSGMNNNDRISNYLDSNGDFNALLAATIPAGTYEVRNLNLVAGLVVNLEGPVTFYVSGDFNMAASVNLLGNPNFSPSAFRVRVLPGGRVNFLANLLTPLNMDLYAPDSDINIAVGVNQFKGRMVGRRLDIMLPLLGQFEEDQTLGDPLIGASRFSIVR